MLKRGIGDNQRKSVKLTESFSAFTVHPLVNNVHKLDLHTLYQLKNG